jgi:hypothetical protein
MARGKQRKDGMDDIARGNVGTGDQDNFDVSPNDKVAVGAGRMSSGDVKEPKGKTERKTTRP